MSSVSGGLNDTYKTSLLEKDINKVVQSVQTGIKQKED